MKIVIFLCFFISLCFFFPWSDSIIRSDDPVHVLSTPHRSVVRWSLNTQTAENTEIGSLRSGYSEDGFRTGCRNVSR